MFAGSLLIGLRAQAPVEQSRRRQLEFTADASHELRTPLSVIRAETDLALGGPRDAADYRDTLERVRAEGERLRRLVEDMLWLARFDSHPPRRDEGPADLAALARACGDRFRSVGPAITVAVTGAARPRQRPARVDRPAGRRAAGQRVPACRAGRPGPDRGRREREPGHADRGGQRPRDPGGAAAPALRPVLPGDGGRIRGRAWAWPSVTRWSAPPEAAGRSATRPWAARGWRCPGGTLPTRRGVTVPSRSPA